MSRHPISRYQQKLTLTSWKTKTPMNYERLLEGFADAGLFAIQLCNVLCKVFNRAWNMTLAHAVAAVNVDAALAVIG